MSPNEKDITKNDKDNNIWRSPNPILTAASLHELYHHCDLLPQPMQSSNHPTGILETKLVGESHVLPAKQFATQSATKSKTVPCSNSIYTMSQMRFYFRNHRSLAASPWLIGCIPLIENIPMFTSMGWFHTRIVTGNQGIDHQLYGNASFAYN